MKKYEPERWPNSTPAITDSLTFCQIREPSSPRSRLVQDQSVCGIGPRQRHSGPLSPTAIFGVSFLMGGRADDAAGKRNRFSYTGMPFFKIAEVRVLLE
jgi:hypothetical protein